MGSFAISWLPIVDFHICSWGWLNEVFVSVQIELVSEVSDWWMVASKQLFVPRKIMLWCFQYFFDDVRLLLLEEKAPNSLLLWFPCLCLCVCIYIYMNISYIIYTCCTYSKTHHTKSCPNRRIRHSTSHCFFHHLLLFITGSYLNNLMIGICYICLGLSITSFPWHLCLPISRSHNIDIAQEKVIAWPTNRIAKVNQRHSKPDKPLGFMPL